MALICLGTALRLLDSVVALFAGTIVIGAGTAVANVLLPGLIKRDFPARTGLMTGLYSMSLFGGAALAAGVTVPVQQATGLDWQATLACWGGLAVLALLFWLPRTGRRTRVARAAAQEAAHPVRGLWRDPLAWQVTGYMGLQSLSYYAAAAWLPTMLTDAGLSAGDAGWMLSFSSLLGIAGSFLAPVVVGRRLPAGVLAAVGALLCAAAFTGVLLAPAEGAYLWMVLLGLGQGRRSAWRCCSSSSAPRTPGTPRSSPARPSASVTSSPPPARPCWARCTTPRAAGRCRWPCCWHCCSRRSRPGGARRARGTSRAGREPAGRRGPGGTLRRRPRASRSA